MAFLKLSNLNPFPFIRHQTAFAFMWSLCKVGQPFIVKILPLLASLFMSGSFSFMSFVDLLVSLQLHV